MRMYDIILKKRNGEELSENEIRFFVEEYTKGNIPDYQASALLMAIYFSGMTEKETVVLTKYMADSGEKIDLSDFGNLSVDKHSTGGVGDKTTLIVAPIVAAAGCYVTKMSGRGLGHTGGTVDKLESVKGYKTVLSQEDFFNQIKKINISVIGQSGNLAPADKKLYALRDVTATVDSIPLITSSIMSKKIAAGSKNIVLDVKVGSGAFMKTYADALKLAENMVNIGKQCGRNTAAVISNMNVPLGNNIGNSLEVAEAVKILKGEQKDSLCELCIILAALMIKLAFNIDLKEAQKIAEEMVESKKAIEKFKEWITYQGGNALFVEDFSLLGKAKFSKNVVAGADGYVSSMQSEKIGIAAMILGAGRSVKDGIIDYNAGIVLNKKTGDSVLKDDVVCTLYTERQETLKAAEECFKNAFKIGAEKPLPESLIKKIIF